MNDHESKACVENFETYCVRHNIDPNGQYTLETIWPAWYDAWRLCRRYHEKAA